MKLLLDFSENHVCVKKLNIFPVFYNDNEKAEKTLCFSELHKFLGLALLVSDHPNMKNKHKLWGDTMVRNSAFLKFT